MRSNVFFRGQARTFTAAVIAFGFFIRCASALDITTATIADLQATMEKGTLTAEKLTQFYLARIDAYDQQGPTLKAFLHLNPKALDEARALDAERKAKGPRGPLHGMVAVVKDVFDTYDMPTTGGYIVLKGVKPTKDEVALNYEI